MSFTAHESIDELMSVVDDLGASSRGLVGRTKLNIGLGHVPVDRVGDNSGNLGTSRVLEEGDILGQSGELGANLRERGDHGGILTRCTVWGGFME